MPARPHVHQRIVRQSRQGRPSHVNPDVPVDITIDAGLGRLYVSGEHQDVIAHIGGAAHNDRRDAHEVSLTLKSLRTMRATLRMSKEEFARHCTSNVLLWARRAGQIERALVELHQRIDAGWRLELPWLDRQLLGRRPFDHQQIMSSVACSLDGCVFICGVGTGKTRAALESLQHKIRTEQIECAFVVCPNRVIKTWREQTPIWTNFLRVVTLTGPMRERAAVIRENWSRGTVFVVNHDTFAELAPTILEYAHGHKIGLVIDEIQKFKNPNAQRTKAALRVAAACPWRLGLTATPVLQGAHDIWSQWYICDLGVEFGASFVQFKREFFVPNNYTMELLPRRGTLDELGVRMRKRGVRFATEDCLDLPPQIDLDPFYVEMTNEQKRAYRQMEDDLVVQFESGEIASAAVQLTTYLRLLQITSGFVSLESGGIHRFDPNPKLDLLEEVVRDNINSEQVIIWAHYREDLDVIAHRFRDLQPAILRGGMSLDATDAAENRFRDGTTRLFLGQPSAGGLGLNLQASSMALYYSMWYSLEDWLQSRGRNWRSGSERHTRIAYGTFRCRGTIDDIVFSSLTEKKNIADIVVDLRNHIQQRLLT